MRVGRTQEESEDTAQEVRLRLAPKPSLFWSRIVPLGENPKEFTKQILEDIERGSINYKIKKQENLTILRD